MCKCCPRGRSEPPPHNPLPALLLAGLVALLIWLAISPAHAASAKQPAVRIPPAAALYRHRVEQAVARAWGVKGSPALLAAQLHQESTWKERARSHVGALGIAQFMPATAAWMTVKFGDELPTFDPFNPQQAIMAAALYDKYLYDESRRIGLGTFTFCDRWAFALRAYNGGLGNLRRERTLAWKNGSNANSWLAVEPYRSRAKWAHKENTHYPRVILLRLEPAYIAAGWRGGPTCP